MNQLVGRLNRLVEWLNQLVGLVSPAGRKSYTESLSKRHEFPLTRPEATLFPHRGRVALLGIAQRQIRTKFSHKLRKQNHAKPLPESIKTAADWIQVKRHEKNLTPAHLATKMGIATALVHSWEDGTSQPDNRQLKVLANLLGPTTYVKVVRKV